MEKRKIVPIVYPPGCYGNYLEWVLTTLISDCEISPPFNANGNSHRFVGSTIYNNYATVPLIPEPLIPAWEEYMLSAAPRPIMRLHPKQIATELVSENIETILRSVDRVVQIYPSRDSVLLIINNMFTKVWKDWWDHHITHNLIDINRIYKNWNIDSSTPIKDIPIWVKREFLSYYLMPAFHSQLDWYLPDIWSHPRCCTIFVNELLWNFEFIVSRIQKHTNLKFVRPISDLVPYHQTMLSMQVHVNQDRLCKKIMESILTNTDFDWSDQELPLASQIWIQWELRNLGYELRCHGLDLFPTNSVYLQELTYKL